MKAISIKQPWANMIASSEKTIETRTWYTSYRGEILICSSKTPKISPAGFALAMANLNNCRPMTKEDESRACCEIYRGAWALCLSDIRGIEPFPIKGQLGIFDLELPQGGLKFL